jgi:hypothetical protein
MATELPATFTFSTKLGLETAVSTDRCRSCLDKGHIAKRRPKCGNVSSDLLAIVPADGKKPNTTELNFRKTDEYKEQEENDVHERTNIDK